MKICVVFFTPRHKVWHEYTDELVNCLVHWYKKSKTSLEPCILTDSRTHIPSSWPYEIAHCEIDVPPFSRYADDVAVWIAAQAYEAMGRCVLIDIDALLVQSVDELAEVKSDMAMTPNNNQSIKIEWGNCHMLNSGVMIINRSIFQEYQMLYTEYSHEAKDRLYGMAVLSKMNKDHGNVILSPIYNWYSTYAANDEAKIIHFCGSEKRKIKKFTNERSLLFL